MTTYVLASGYHDMDDVTIYGPFAAYDEAMAAIPENSPEDTEWRVWPLKSVARIQKDVDEEPEEPEAVEPGHPLYTQQQIKDLTAQYGSLEAVPAPNPIIYAEAQRVQQGISRTYFEGGEINDWEQAAARMKAASKDFRKGIFALRTNQGIVSANLYMLNQGRAVWDIWMPLLEKHRPADG